MHPALQHTAHRPWPLPAREWTWRQSWLDLAFLHYRVAAGPLRQRLPTGLTLQEFDGAAWVGLVPFRMAGVMRRPLPDVPGFSEFPELNLRTYVEAGGKPGVWFFSLDADSWPVVFGGRTVFGLPYFRAKMQQRAVNDGWSFTSQRHAAPASFAGRYRAVGEEFLAQPGTFEHWATERYCLYAQKPRGPLRRLEVHHAPWPLQRAEVEIEENEILAAGGFATKDAQPICHFSRGVHVVSYAPETVR
ncbi:MAG: hypothetical protein C0518_12750 [Opitutus sp.]|nr:hypothetical protein [Opitutus sp.]